MTTYHTTLTTIIWNYLNHYAYYDATFLAERLLAENVKTAKEEASRYLLATCYYRSNKKFQAYSILKEFCLTQPESKFLLAKCCVDLDKLGEAEMVIAGNDSMKVGDIGWIVSEYGEHSPFVLQLLAGIWFKTDRMTISCEAYEEALKIDPCLWSSFRSLCDQGFQPSVEAYFQPLLDIACEIKEQGIFIPTLTASKSVAHINNSAELSDCALEKKTTSIASTSHITPDNNAPLAFKSPVIIPEAISDMLGSKLVKPMEDPGQFSGDKTQDKKVSVAGTSHFTPENVPLTTFSPPPIAKKTAYKTPYNVISSSSDSLASPLTSSFGVAPLEANTPNDSSFVTNSTGHSDAISVENENERIIKKRKTIAVLERLCGINSSEYTPPLRRNNRTGLYNFKTVTDASAEKSLKSLRARNHKTVLTTRLNRNEKTNVNGVKKKEWIKRCLSDPLTKITNAKHLSDATDYADITTFENVIRVVKTISAGYIQLTQFNGWQALKIFKALPIHHRDTSFVLGLCGKVCLDLNDVEGAKKYFDRSLQLEPFQDRAMDVYSTALWLLQKEDELVVLTNSMLASHSNNPITWCVVGNHYSLQRNHDMAIEFLKRAIALDGDYCYAYTLLGHEYIVLDELNLARRAFRNAIRIDPRHYNAWYGLGTTYMKEKYYQTAEIQFRKVLSIFPNNAVILCNLAVILRKMNRLMEAVEVTNQALSIEPRRPLCKYQRAFLNFTLGNHAESLAECQELKVLVPKEAEVYYLIAHNYKQMGDHHLAMMYLTSATNFDPKITDHCHLSLPTETLHCHNTPLDLSRASAQLSTVYDRHPYINYRSPRRLSSDSDDSV